jgi:hypothetical protein
MYFDVSSVLPDDPILVETLSKVQPQVLKLVQGSMPHIWTSIAYHLRVNFLSPRPERYISGKPTIIVFCRPGTNHPTNQLGRVSTRC